MRPSLTHLLLFVIILVLLFGSKRLPELGGAMGRSIKAFKKGLKEANEGEGKE